MDSRQMFPKYDEIVKGWGTEKWYLNDPDLCMKVLCIKEGGKCSMHFHAKKKEIFYIIKGEMMFEYINTDNGDKSMQLTLSPGDAVVVEPLTPHRFSATLPGGCTFVESSLHHDDSDSYRVEPGDSQLKGN